MKKYLFMVCLLILSVTSCQEDKMDERFMAYDEVSILTYLQEHPEYSLWYSLLGHSGLAPAYNFSTTPLTFFTVKNEVLQAYLQKKGYNSVADMPVELAKQLIQYHTMVHKSYELADFRDGKLADSTASGDYLSCLLVADAGNDAENGIFLNRTSKIVIWDIKTVNGIIHEVNQVIDPVMYNLYDFLVQNSKYTILREAYEATGLDSLLSQLNRNDMPLKCRRTLFVTSDSIFGLQNINSLADLKIHLNAGEDLTSLQNALNLYLRYRILNDDYSTTELARLLSYGAVKGIPTVDEAKGITISTMAENKLIQIQAKGVKYFFNESQEFVDNLYNLQVRNGFVHEINGIFDIFEPEQITMAVEPTDFLNFKQIPEYRNDPIQKTMVDLKASAYSPSLIWKSTPADKKMAMAYIVFTEGGYNFKDNEFRHGDCLFADLGPVGQVEIKTCPIPKGKYKISVFFKSVKVSGGIFQPYLDGEKTNKTVSAYGGLGYDSYDLREIGTFTFNETHSHTFTLKVSSPGELHWDLILFESVK